MPLPHGSLVGEVDEPPLLQDLGPDTLGLLDRLNQTLDWNVGLDAATLELMTSSKFSKISGKKTEHNEEKNSDFLSNKKTLFTKILNQTYLAHFYEKI